MVSRAPPRTESSLGFEVQANQVWGVMSPRAEPLPDRGERMLCRESTTTLSRV